MKERQQGGERHPPLSVQFGQGQVAFMRGWLSNQYNPESNKGKEWQRGFDRAYFDNIAQLKR
jgi:hypothetical protein